MVACKRSRRRYDEISGSGGLRLGQVRLGTVRRGKVLGEVRPGQARRGKVRRGQAGRGKDFHMTLDMSRYPTLERVEEASREQLARWQLELPSPDDDHRPILERIMVRLSEAGGISPEISKRIRR